MKALGRAIVLLSLVIGIPVATGQPPDPSAVAIRVGDSMHFEPPVIEARPGQPLRVVVANDARTAIKHTFVVLRKGADPKRFAERAATAPDRDRDQVIASTGLIASGERGAASFTAPAAPGEYPFLCTVPGHFKLGMQGRLVIH